MSPHTTCHGSGQSPVMAALAAPCVALLPAPSFCRKPLWNVCGARTNLIPLACPPPPPGSRLRPTL